jgi:integrase
MLTRIAGPPRTRQVENHSGEAEPNAGEAGRSWQSALLRMDGAYSANTIRCYRTDFTIFETWCKRKGHLALPALPKTVADFVTAQSESAAPATVNRRRASIAKIHRLLGLENPVRTEEVNLATRTMFRKKGRRQDQALGLTAPLKHKIIAACPETPAGLRDRALIAVGYDTLCRRAELVQLRVDDLIIKTNGSGTILVRKAKSDQFGDGRLAYLSAEAIDHLKRWLRAANLTVGPIFRAILPGGAIATVPIEDYAVSSILKAGAKRAGLGEAIIAKLSGHSLRVGAAQDMAAAGIDLGAIMHAGGWKSPDMVMRYIEHTDVQRSGMARLHQILR